MNSLTQTITTIIKKTGRAVVALDGDCAAGKTTLAAVLARELSGAVVHMDDFFLPPELRTDARLAEAGGNVDYERFAAEVLPRLRAGGAFSYRAFSCREMRLSGVREIPAAPLVVVEGAYSLHPFFGKYYDLSVFLSIDPAAQLSRIEKRNGKDAVRVFAEKWIPMEKRYQGELLVKEKVDIVLGGQINTD